MASLKSILSKSVQGDAPLGFDPLANDEARLATLRLDDIEPDPNQPRTDLGDLEGLVASIRQNGIIQPLVVSPLDDTRFRIIAGERRYTAAKQLGLRTVPALVRTVDDHRRTQIQLIENLHRKDLDAFEEAGGYQRLLAEFNLTHELIAEQVGKSRTHITQMLSICRIPRELRAECKLAGVSRETLFLIAKQEEPDRMAGILDAARSGADKHEQREIARKGQPRASTMPQAERKPKQAYRTGHEAIVIVQSLTEALTRERILGALNDALDHARNEEEES